MATTITNDATAPPEAPVRAHLGLTLFALCAAGLVVSLQQTVVIPLLFRLQTQLHTDVSGVTWLFTAALLTGAISTPLLSRFGDMYGKKTMVLVCLTLLTVGSVVCALAGSLPLYIAGRALQGVSTAMIPLAIGIIRDTFPREQLTTAIGVVSGTMGVGGSVGMLVTGAIAQKTTDPHPIFWMVAALSAATLAVIVFTVRDIGVRHGGKPDYIGTVLLAILLSCLLLGISEGPEWGWGSARVVGLLIGAVVVTAIWVLVELRVAQPLVRLPLLVGAKSLSANVISVLLGFAMYGSFTLVSNFVQAPHDKIGYGLSGSVLDVGLYGLPSTVLMTFFSFRAGRIVARIGAAYTLAIGSLFAAASAGWLVFSNAHGYDMLIANALQGAGFGIAYAALGTLAVQHVPMSESGIASGINSLVRTTGGAVAGAVTASMLTTFTMSGTRIPSLQAYTLSFVVLSLAALVGAGVAGAHALRHRD